jgi:hypothetical protein
MKTILIIGLFLNLIGALVTAHAEEPKGSPKSRQQFKKSESHQFSGLKLKGQLKKPELSYIYKRKGLRVEQIVNIPGNFNDKIVEDARQF